MTVSDIEAAGDLSDIFESWSDHDKKIVWNGREIEVLAQKRTDQLIKVQSILQSLNTEEKIQPLFNPLDFIKIDLEESPLEFALPEYEFTLINAEQSQPEIIPCSFLKRIWDGVKKGAKKAAKVFKKVIAQTADMVRRAAEEIAHGTKKAAEKVADFVKDHKKETLIAAAIIAAIAGAFIISGTLSGGAVATGARSTTKRKEDEEDHTTSTPSNPPPLPDWVSELLKSTTPDFSPDKFSETSLENAKKEAHDAWNLFNHLKSDTENHLRSLKEFHPEFNPSSHALETILNTVLQDPQKYAFSKNLLSSQNWTDIIKSGHEKIDHAFAALSSRKETSIASPPPIKSSRTFLEKIQLGLEIIGRGMLDPELLDPNSSIDTFLKDDQNKQASAFEGQTIKDFFETINDAKSYAPSLLSSNFSNTGDYQKNTETVLETPLQYFKDNQFSFTKSTFTSLLKMVSGASFSLKPLFSLSELSKSKQSKYFETEGIKRDDILITFINGMGNSFEDANSSLNYIKGLSSRNLRIEGIYNHSSGLITDLMEIFFCNYSGYSPITQNLLIQKWTEFHEKNKEKPYAKILHFCHSQGSLHTKNALIALSQEIRDRVIVVAIAPATIIPEWICYRSYNYASKKDIVHYGEDLMLFATIASIDDEEQQREQLQIHQNRKNRLILLDPHEKATNIDHTFITPTFRGQIEEHLDEYFEHEGEYP